MASNAPRPVPALLTLRRGTLRIDGATYERYFAGCPSVILLPRDGRLLILPVASLGGGGNIVKVVNARGDRGVAAADLFRELGLCEDCLEGDGEATYEAYWSSEQAGLVVDGFYTEDAP
jgi:hypothetical protein